jgi:hypothetical protein
MLATVEAGGGKRVPAFVSRTCRPVASWTASAMFCLLQSMPSASSGSPGSDSFVFCARASRAAILSFSAASGSARMRASVACASAALDCEPATPNQIVRSPPAGTVRWYVSAPPAPLP